MLDVSSHDDLWGDVFKTQYTLDSIRPSLDGLVYRGNKTIKWPKLSRKQVSELYNGNNWENMPLARSNYSYSIIGLQLDPIQSQIDSLKKEIYCLKEQMQLLINTIKK